MSKDWDSKIAQITPVHGNLYIATVITKCTGDNSGGSVSGNVTLPFNPGDAITFDNGFIQTDNANTDKAYATLYAEQFNLVNTPTFSFPINLVIGTLTQGFGPWTNDKNAVILKNHYIGKLLEGVSPAVGISLNPNTNTKIYYAYLSFRVVRPRRSYPSQV